jgi:hypothetical protein
MTDSNAPLTPHQPRELCNLEKFYKPKPGDQGNIAGIRWLSGKSLVPKQVGHGFDT